MYKSSQLADPMRWRFVASGVLASACWGLATIMSKGVVESMPPVTLLVVQLVASVTFLWTVVAWQRSRLPLNWRTLKLGLTGLLEPGVTYTFTLIGLTLTTASKASLLIGAIEPVAIVLLAGLLLRERITRPLVVLLSLACVGVVLVLSANATANNSSVLGDLLILLGTFCAALYVVLTRRLVANLSPLPLTALQQTVGLFLALFLWSVELLHGTTDLTAIATETWFWAVTSGIVQYALAFWFYLIVLRGMQAKLASLFLTLIPVFGVGGAYLFLDERLTALQWGGVALVLVALVNISRLRNV